MSYRNQSIDLLCKSMDWFLYDNSFRHERANCMEGEADSQLILHVANARAQGFKNFFVLSNDSDVVTYLSAYFDKFKTKNVEKIRVKYGLKERQRHIPIHCLADIFGSGKSRVLPKTHILTGCDFTSKVRSKLSFNNAELEKFSYE